MTYIKAVADFKRVYKDLWENHVDYWTAFEAWSTYIDSLCKDRQITQKQYNTWSTPFPYGRRLGVGKSIRRY